MRGGDEVFTLADGQPVCLPASGLRVEKDKAYVGDGAVRYRAQIAAAGGVVADDDAPEHVPWASLHGRLAKEFGPADAAEPIYLRVPDAERALT